MNFQSLFETAKSKFEKPKAPTAESSQPKINKDVLSEQRTKAVSEDADRMAEIRGRIARNEDVSQKDLIDSRIAIQGGKAQNELNRALNTVRSVAEASELGLGSDRVDWQHGEEPPESVKQQTEGAQITGNQEGMSFDVGGHSSERSSESDGGMFRLEDLNKKAPPTRQDRAA